MVQECLTFATTPIFGLLAWASKYEKAPGAGRFFGNLFNVARVCWILWPIVLLLGKPLCSQVGPGWFNLVLHTGRRSRTSQASFSP